MIRAPLSKSGSTPFSGAPKTPTAVVALGTRSTRPNNVLFAVGSDGLGVHFMLVSG